MRAGVKVLTGSNKAKGAVVLACTLGTSLFEMTQGRLEGRFELLESEIEQMTVMDLPFRLKKLGIL